MNEKKVCDAHIHLVQCSKNSSLNSLESFFQKINDSSKNYYACTCAHSIDEFFEQEKICKKFENDFSIRFIKTFGIHPQNPCVQNIQFLEKLLNENKINAIGEAGFDLFSEEFKQKIELQEKVWNVQLELAHNFSKPLVVHCRKGLQYVFRDFLLLKKVPSVIFHSFCGGFYEAQGILKKGINAYFSFGKQLLKGSKKSAECVRLLPESHLLFETDAPFQTLKDESFTNLCDIKKVYEKGIALRFDEKKIDIEKFYETIYQNFCNCFLLN